MVDHWRKSMHYWLSYLSLSSSSKRKRSSSVVRRKIIFNYRKPYFLLFTFLILLQYENARSQPLLNISSIPEKISSWFFKSVTPLPNVTSTVSPVNSNDGQGQGQGPGPGPVPLATFPITNGHQQIQVQQHFIQQPSNQQEFQVQGQPNQQLQAQNVYPTSGEQLQNWVNANNGPLSQGIPIVQMDQNSNSITIVSPAVQNQLVPQQNNMNLGGNTNTGQGGVLVAQPINFNIHNIHNKNLTEFNEKTFMSNQHPGPIVQIMPPTFQIAPGVNAGGHNQFQAMPPLPPGPEIFQNHNHNHNQNQHTLIHSGSGNVHVGIMSNPNNFPQHDQHQMQQQFQQAPPPPPPPPKNFKGGIIAVPKQQLHLMPPSPGPMLIPHPTHYFGSSLGNNPPFIPHRFPPTGLNIGAPMSQSQINPPLSNLIQPVASIHPVPVPINKSPANTAPALPGFALNKLQPLHSLSDPEPASRPPSHHHVIPVPEINKTRNEILHPALNQSLLEQQYFFQVPEGQENDPMHQQYSDTVNPQYNDPGNQQYPGGDLEYIVEQGSSSREKYHPSKAVSAAPSHRPYTEISSDLVGSPRTPRKRHRGKQSSKEALKHYEKQKSVRGNIYKSKSTSGTGQRVTQIPLPAGDDGEDNTYDESFHHHQDHQNHPPSISDYSLSTIMNLPSTTITGSFEYPDPPTPVNYQSMNAIKDPSPHHDSPEVGVTIPGLNAADFHSSRLKKRLKAGRKQRQQKTFSSTFNLHNTPFKRVTTTSSSAYGTTAGQASSLYNTFATASALPVTEKERRTYQRELTTYPTSISTSKRSKKGKSSRNKGKSNDMNFFASNHQQHYKMSEVNTPSFFRPSPQIHSFEDSISGKKSYITILPPVTSQSEKVEDVRNKKDLSKLWRTGRRFEPSESKSPYEIGFRPFGSLVTTVDSLTVTYPYERFTTAASKVSTDPFKSSSERVENWHLPDNTDGTKMYFGNGKFAPPNCFHRFGFCPVGVNSGYPTNEVEKIALRCSALLSHLIAPLPAADVRYDVIVSKNGSMLKDKSPKTTGWQWKSFKGTPICETKEIKVIPGWAKNEQGEWLVILQTKAFKQEAQVTLCAPQGSHYNCNGNTTTTKESDDCKPIKCVQRFTSQRLAVLDPENSERCPVLRSVYLPSACVCLISNYKEERKDDKSKKSRSLTSASVAASSEELSASSSNTNVIKVGNSKSSKKSNSKSKGKKGKGSSSKSKGKKSSSKKPKSSRQNKALPPPEKTNAHSAGSSEEDQSKSDMLDTAADSSTSGRKVHQLQASIPPAIIKPSEKEDNVTSSQEDDNDVEDNHDQPKAEELKGKVTEEEDQEGDDSDQNEVDAEDEEDKSGKNDKEEVEGSTTVADGDDASTVGPEGDDEEEEESSEETKAQGTT